MVREVITLPLRIGTLPLRIGARATRLGFHVAEQAVTAGLRATERLIEVAVPRPPAHADDAEDVEAPSSLRVNVVVAPPLSIHEPAPPAAPLATEPPEPAEPEVDVTPEIAPQHVSEDAELVESFAEAGAEDGAGAAVHVQEPWKGYGDMTANEIVARLPDASREELAAIDLYERVHRGRRTVVAAADRQLRRATAAAHDAPREGERRRSAVH